MGNFKIINTTLKKYEGNNLFVEVPEYIQYIKKHAFENCTKLKRVQILNPDVQFENEVFKNCENLKRISWAGKFFKSDVIKNCNNIVNILKHPSQVRENLKNVYVLSVDGYYCKSPDEQLHNIENINKDWNEYKRIKFGNSFRCTKDDILNDNVADG